jgi:hypothetical protein
VDHPDAEIVHGPPRVGGGVALHQRPLEVDGLAGVIAQIYTPGESPPVLLEVAGHLVGARGVAVDLVEGPPGGHVRGLHEQVNVILAGAPHPPLEEEVEVDEVRTWYV